MLRLSVLCASLWCDDRYTSTQVSEAALCITFAAATGPELALGIERLGKDVCEEFRLA